MYCTCAEKELLFELLLSNHQAFSLEEHERGETDLVMCAIDTGDCAPSPDMYSLCSKGRD